MNSLFDLTHPYSRYGLAVALLEERIGVEELSEAKAPEILARAIETGLSSFRLSTDDDPTIADTLHFRYLRIDEFQTNPSLIRGKLSEQGKYLAPNAVTTDGDVKETWDNCNELIQELRSGKKTLIASAEFKKSFAPTTTKFNNGIASQHYPKGSLFERACCAITTLTPLKASAFVKDDKKGDKFINAVIIPDLPMWNPVLRISEMKDFVELFNDMLYSNLDGNLMEAQVPKQPAADSIRQTTARRKKKESSKPKSEYRRPRLHNGNYPFAPRDPAFGAAGLLGAIGKWAQLAGKTDWAKRVLESIAGSADQPGRPLYIISYNGVTQVQFTHHVVNLSLNGKLSELIDSIRETTLYSEIGKEKQDNRPKWEVPAYRLFYLMANRFLQLFNPPAFRDVLSIRAEYAPAVSPLFEEYFMKTKEISPEIVESARALGQWLNRTAYFVADGEVEANAADRRNKVQKAKAKILVEFESAAMSAENAQDMLHRVSTRAGRLLQQDAPAEATRFMDAANSGVIEAQDALHLLISYLRLRATKAENDNA